MIKKRRFSNPPFQPPPWRSLGISPDDRSTLCVLFTVLRYNLLRMNAQAERLPSLLDADDPVHSFVGTLFETLFATAGMVDGFIGKVFRWSSDELAAAARASQEMTEKEVEILFEKVAESQGFPPPDGSTTH
jgi:hypothetical protein